MAKIQLLFAINKVHESLFDICDQSTAKSPKLFQLIGGDGGVAHATTIYNNMIYDSNLDSAVTPNNANLEYCVDASYTSVMWGYEIFPIHAQGLSKSKKQSKKRRVKKVKEKKRFKTF
jgi:hypothetical protein